MSAIQTSAHGARWTRSATILGLLLGLTLATHGCAQRAGSSNSEPQIVAQDGDGGRGDGGAGGGDGTSRDETPRYEAENLTAQSGSAVASHYAGYTGTGFVEFGNNGSWIEWNNIRAALAGKYTLTLRFANGGRSERPATVSVNEGSDATVQFEPTGDEWTSWWTTSLVVSLRQGDNTIRITANSSAGGPNLDHAVVVRNDPCPSDPSETAPGLCDGDVAMNLCPTDPNKAGPGECACGVPEGSCGGTSSTLVKLPIEVLGPAGTRQTVQVRVDNPQDVTHLYVRCNSCGYHDTTLDGDASKVKATLRVNGGAAIALKHYTAGSRVVGDSRIELIGAEADYGGIGGAFRTVRIKVPVTGLVAGINTLTFEHVTAAPPSIGFRILELNLLRAGSLLNRVLGEADFLHDDPTTWTPPSTSTADVSAGRALWLKRNSLYDPGVDALDGALNRAGAVSGNISASCADCHAADERDLAYFNFSNHSIIERAYFHGLSKQEGSLIASYIRSLGLAVVRAARPWNPTYQPGPGLDARPVHEWAAGAGVDAILDSDSDMAPYLFPVGNSLAAVRQVVDRYGTLNLRELPVSLPMPEWNQWLPIIHPDDAFDTEASAIRADAGGASLGQPYYTALYQTARASPTPSNLGSMTSRIKAWLRRDMTCMSNDTGNGEPWRGLNGAVLDAIKLPKPTITASNCKDTRSRAQDAPFEIAKRGLAAFIAVKQWEIVHGNKLEAEGSKATTPVCSSGRCIDASEVRGWTVDGRNVFDRAAHFVGHNSRHFLGQDRVSGILETNAWYHLNMILNPGYRTKMPNHFAYVYSHVEILQDESKVDQGYRFWASVIKQRQLQTNGKYGLETGLDLRTAQPYVYYSSRFGGTDAQGSVGQPLWGYLAQTLIDDFVADANNATPEDWASASGNSAVQSSTSTDFSPCDSCFDPSSRTDPFGLDALQGRNTYRVIPKFREIGVSSTTLSSLISWGAKTWPNGNWDALR